MRDRRRRTARPEDAGALTCPSYDDLRVQSAVLAYVIGEGHHGETVFEPARRLSPDGEGYAVERAVRDLVGAGLLSMYGSKVVPGRASFAGVARNEH